MFPAASLSGMNAARVSMSASAFNIANLETPNFRRQQTVQTATSGGVATQVVQADAPGDAPESDVVNMLSAKNGFLANLAVFRTDERMTGALLDVTA